LALPNIKPHIRFGALNWTKVVISTQSIWSSATCSAARGRQQTGGARRVDSAFGPARKWEQACKALRDEVRGLVTGYNRSTYWQYEYVKEKNSL